MHSKVSIHPTVILFIVFVVSGIGVTVKIDHAMYETTSGVSVCMWLYIC